MFETAFRWLFGDAGRSHGLRLRHIGPLELDIPEEAAELPDVPMIQYGGGLVAHFKSDDLLFPEDGPQLSITELEPRGDLGAQVDEAFTEIRNRHRRL